VWLCLPFFCGPAITCLFVCLSEVKTEKSSRRWLGSRTRPALNQARDTQRQSEAARQKTIEDLARLGRAISTAMVGLGVSLEPMTPKMLVEEVGRLPSAVQELELATARRAVH
jgi:hypothetical protein